MNIDEMLEISDCPLCEGGALLEEECGCSYYVMCLECGCHTVNIDFRSEQEGFHLFIIQPRRNLLCGKFRHSQIPHNLLNLIQCPAK